MPKPLTITDSTMAQLRDYKTKGLTKKQVARAYGLDLDVFNVAIDNAPQRFRNEINSLWRRRPRRSPTTQVHQRETSPATAWLTRPRGAA